MINHLRTLLLNEGETELVAAGLTSKTAHTSPFFVKASLPDDFKRVYDLLFPTEEVDYKLLLVNAYMGLLQACGMREAFLLGDSRMTYLPEKHIGDYVSQGASVGIPQTENATAPGIQLRVFHTQSGPGPLESRTERVFSVVQTANTSTVQVFEDAQLLTSAALVFSDGVSQKVPVPDPSRPGHVFFEFSIAFVGDFTASADKEWEVRLFTPLPAVLEPILKNLLTQQPRISSLLSKYSPSVDVTSYDRQWLQHFNSHYRLAALLVSLGYRIDNFTP